jgi:hypothetical protein
MPKVSHLPRVTMCMVAGTRAATLGAGLALNDSSSVPSFCGEWHRGL